jgi:hypothetical protein
MSLKSGKIPRSDWMMMNSENIDPEKLVLAALRKMCPKRKMIELSGC